MVSAYATTASISDSLSIILNIDDIFQILFFDEEVYQRARITNGEIVQKVFIFWAVSFFWGLWGLLSL